MTDLPAGIGAPARRALHQAGLTSLDQLTELTELTEAELLALHGVGPKAVRILRTALADRGQDLRTP